MNEVVSPAGSGLLDYSTIRQNTHSNDRGSSMDSSRTTSLDGLSMQGREITNNGNEFTNNGGLAVQSPQRTNCPHPHHPAHREHLQKSRQYYRDMMLGVNDGLVSTLLLVAGVVGGGMDVSGVLLTAVSGAIAGAISMFAGEYVATKSQNEVMTGEIKLEHEHIMKYHAEEMQELSNLLSLIGLPASSPNLNDCEEANTIQTETQQLTRMIRKYYGTNPDALLKIMIALELGVIDDEVRSPIVAGGTSFCLFFLGALPSTVPFAFVSDVRVGLISAAVATALGLFLVGAVKSWATRGNFCLSACENLFITVAGGGVAYGIGVAFQNLIGEDI